MTEAEIRNAAIERPYFGNREVIHGRRGPQSTGI